MAQGAKDQSKFRLDVSCAKTVLNQIWCQFSSTSLSLKCIIIFSVVNIINIITIMRKRKILFFCSLSYFWANSQNVSLEWCQFGKKKYEHFTTKTIYLRLFSFITAYRPQANFGSVSLDLQMHFWEIISVGKVLTEAGGYTPQNLKLQLKLPACSISIF